MLPLLLPSEQPITSHRENALVCRSRARPKIAISVASCFLPLLSTSHPGFRAVIDSLDMASLANPPAGPYLERLKPDANPTFTEPSKRINDGDDLTFLLGSKAYGDLVTWLLQLNRSMFPRKDDHSKVEEARLDTPPSFSKNVQHLQSLISDLQGLIKDAPPDTGPRRFGNVAFRTWFKLAEEHATSLIERHLGPVLQQWAGQDGQKRDKLRDELKTYLVGSFGSAQRLDYGTGHELSFIAFLGCLWKLGAFEDGEERSIVLGLIQP